MGILKRIASMFGDGQKPAEEPRVEWKSGSIDPIMGLSMQLDWNDEFIIYLRQSGYTGSSDEDIVQQWLSVIAKQQAENLKDANAFK